jgi:hypothetical protein
MKRIWGLDQLTLVVVIAISSLLTFGVAAASAESTWLCVPKTAGKAVTSGGTEGKCEGENTKVELPPAAELPTLVSILPYIKYVASGIGSKPTIKFEGANVQIVNGEGTTGTKNSKGNLVIGYNEGPGTQTGSHNLILGDEQTFTSFGGILAGFGNTISGGYASVTGGAGNTANSTFASVSGGSAGTASGVSASVSGGHLNTASGLSASVSGGESNTASGDYASVSGGSENKAEATFNASIGGGRANKVTGNFASVFGGYKNTASGNYSSIFGGQQLSVTKEEEACGFFPTVYC